MKEFRKIENGLFVCEECGLLCGDKKYLSKHVRKTHNIKKYYDKWLKEEREGKCKICGEEFYVSCSPKTIWRNTGQKDDRGNPIIDEIVVIKHPKSADLEEKDLPDRQF